MGLLSTADWSARWIAHVVPDLSSEPEEIRRQTPAPVLRRQFTLPGVPGRARRYITALGVYEAYINGTRVGDERLAPGWTDYNIRLQYQTYDVTPLLHAGDNVLAVRLGDGWYAGTVGAWGRHRYGDGPALLCQLESELLTVASDDQWVARGSGTWLNDLQTGERTDLRNEPGDSGWGPRRSAPHPVVDSSPRATTGSRWWKCCPPCQCAPLLLIATSSILAPMPLSRPDRCHRRVGQHMIRRVEARSMSGGALRREPARCGAAG